MISRAPFVGFVLCFVLGLLLAEWLPVLEWLIELSVGMLVAGLLGFVAYRFNCLPLANFLLHSLVMLMGLLMMGIENYSYRKSLSDPKFQNVQTYIFRVESLPQKRRKTVQFTGRIERISGTAGWIDVEEKLLVMIPLESGIIPKPGDRLLVKGHPELPALPLNPNQFDYRKFLRDKGIFRTDFIPEGGYRVLPTVERWSITNFALHISAASDRVFREAISDDSAYGLVKAMLLGRRDDLRTDQINDFAVSGAVHILSVSGLHVGILYLVFATLLGWVKKIRWGRTIYLLAMLSLLCFYALLTGLPDSVVRATLMFAVILLAQNYQRQSVSINTLAISALIILLLDPRAIYHVGFQLSYMAMVGILLLYNPIKWLWSPKDRILGFLWEITCLSLAAQLATFPLAVFYFHQFPVYFWLINPLILFIAEFLLQSAVALLIFEFLNLNWLSFLAGFWLEWSAYLANVVVGIPKLLPGNVLQNLYLDAVEVVLLYLAIGMIWLSVRLGRNHFLVWGTLSLLIWAVYAGLDSVNRYFSHPAVIFSIPRQNIIGSKSGKELMIVSSDVFQNKQELYDYYIKNFAIRSGVEHVVFIEKPKDMPQLRRLSQGFLMTCNGKVLYCGSVIQHWKGIDMALITRPVPAHIAPLPEDTCRFVLGGTLSKFQKAKFVEVAKPGQYHDLNQGYLQF